MRFSPLLSGSSGNVSYVETDKARLLIDAGVPARTVEAVLSSIGISAASLDGILVTHEHTDHVKGVGALARRYDLPVYANAATWEAMSRTVGELPLKNVRIFQTGQDFYIKDICVLPFKTPHDAAESVGYRLSSGRYEIGVMTDVGHVSARLLSFLSDLDLLLLEANHDEDMLRAGPYPYPLKRRILSNVGHLSNDAAGETLIKLYLKGVRSAILGHLSRENNTEALCLETVRSILRRECVPEGEFSLALAHRDRVEGMFVL